jgi:aminoglycoside phosphotransferase (APT) family kinase protein
MTSAPNLLALDSLERWLDAEFGPSATPVSSERIGADAGIANALFRIRRGNDDMILRRPPAQKNDPSASNTFREWRILRALEGTRVPHPRPIRHCADETVIGAPFLLMEVVEGFTPGYVLPEPFSSDPELRRGLAMSYVDGIAALSEVDWQARGLDDLGKPAGFLIRQVPRWLGQLARYRTRDLQHLDEVCAWLTTNVPPMSRPGIMHGDYSPFNVMIAPEPPARLAAIVDWDTGTIGDPLLDIGHLLARWTDPGEDPILDLQAGGIDGYPTRAEMAERYAATTGRDLGNLRYYEVLALFKLAVILEGSYARARAAGVAESENMMTSIVPNLLEGAVQFATSERS